VQSCELILDCVDMIINGWCLAATAVAAAAAAAGCFAPLFDDIAVSLESHYSLR